MVVSSVASSFFFRFSSSSLLLWVGSSSLETPLAWEDDPRSSPPWVPLGSDISRCRVFSSCSLSLGMGVLGVNVVLGVVLGFSLTRVGSLSFPVHVLTGGLEHLVCTLLAYSVLQLANLADLLTLGWFQLHNVPNCIGMGLGFESMGFQEAGNLGFRRQEVVDV